MLADMIAELQRLATQVDHLTPPDSALADAIGDLRRIEVILAETRHRWETLVAELDPVDLPPERRITEDLHAGIVTAVGDRWAIEPVYKTVRSFRSAAIIAAVMDDLEGQGFDGADAVRVLRDAGALKVTWSWTGLQRFFRQHRLDLTRTYGPVEDDGDVDAPMVGEDRKQAGVKRVPVKEPLH